MASAAAEKAVRGYLGALNDPTSLRDESTLTQLRKEHEGTTDTLARIQLRQKILDAENPSIESYEEGFVTHAKAWADDKGVTADAFLAEGVDPSVLRRAGFSVSARQRGGSRRRAGRTTRRTRVTADQVRGAIPRGGFTVKQLQERSGASPVVVRKVIEQETKAGRLQKVGPDPDHRGPGRAPVLYKRGK